MNVASLELCKELYELSGWNDTYLRWATFKEPKVVNADEWARNMDGEPDLIVTKTEVIVETTALISAYDLGYILPLLPESIRVDEAIGWATLAVFDTAWQCGYLMDGGYMEKRFYIVADTPEDAAVKLAIELFKQGVLESANP